MSEIKPVLCQQPLRTQTGRIPCRAPAVGQCDVDGPACSVHSRYQVIGPRLCDTCRQPLRPLAEGA